MALITPFMPLARLFATMFKEAIKVELHSEAGKINLVMGLFVMFLATLVIGGQAFTAFFALLFRKEAPGASLWLPFGFVLVYIMFCVSALVVVEHWIQKGNT